MYWSILWWRRLEALKDRSLVALCNTVTLIYGLSISLWKTFEQYKTAHIREKTEIHNHSTSPDLYRYLDAPGHDRQNVVSLTWPFRRVGVSHLYFGRRLEAEIKEEPILELVRKGNTNKFIQVKESQHGWVSGWLGIWGIKKGSSSFDLWNVNGSIDRTYWRYVIVSVCDKVKYHYLGVRKPGEYE